MSDLTGAIFSELGRLLSDRQLLADGGMHGQSLLVLPAAELYTPFCLMLGAVRVRVEIGLRDAEFSLECGEVLLGDGMCFRESGKSWLFDQKLSNEFRTDLTGYDPDWLDNVAGWIRSVSTRWFSQWRAS